MKKNKINLKFIIIFVIYFFVNILVYILFFNLIFKKNFFYIYKILSQKTNLKFFGTFALAGKKINYHGKTIYISQSPFFLKAKAFAIFYLIMFNLVILIFYFILKNKKRKNDSHGSAKWGGIEEIDFKPGKDKYLV